MTPENAKELFRLITKVRLIKEMDMTNCSQWSEDSVPGCLICEGVRAGLYTQTQARGLDLDFSRGFSDYFGCNRTEASRVLAHTQITGNRNETNGENYYQAGKQLLLEYGYYDLFEGVEKGLPFHELMDQMKGELIKC